MKINKEYIIKEMKNYYGLNSKNSRITLTNDLVALGLMNDTPTNHRNIQNLLNMYRLNYHTLSAVVDFLDLDLNQVFIKEDVRNKEVTK